MKKLVKFSIIFLLGCAAVSPVFGAGNANMVKLFPEIVGMTKKGAPDFYTPDNLYEYINGAADVFLANDFQELAALNYEDKQNHSLTVDIYRHGNLNYGFGIYSQEKPVKGEFLEIGTQGYYEKGVLNFFKGSYYVKISGYDLGEKDRAVLTAAAGEIAGLIDGKAAFPPGILCLPAKGKVAGSEKFVSTDFLGHAFLHSAFLADYESQGKAFQVFIMEAADEGAAGKILEDYLKFARGKGSPVSEERGYYTFLDPYYSSSGKMNMKLKGNHVWGLITDDQAKADYYIKEVENLLNKQ